MFARFFIDRPIFAAVLSILITLGGAVGLQRLPVALYPEITPPTIEVSTSYPGAHSKTIADTVAALKLEQFYEPYEGDGRRNQPFDFWRTTSAFRSCVSGHTKPSKP